MSAERGRRRGRCGSGAADLYAPPMIGHMTRDAQTGEPALVECYGAAPSCEGLDIGIEITRPTIRIADAYA